jgi:shikimate kinase
MSAPDSGPRSVFLVGFMGAGKSSVGLALSRKLGWPFEDLDECIEKQECRSIEQIFQQSGEAVFRRLEHAALRSLIRDLGASPTVVAVLEEIGFPVVFLDAPVEELFRRCQQQELNRPLRRDLQEFQRLYETRRPYYLKAALRIETGGKDVERVVTETMKRLGLQ